MRYYKQHARRQGIFYLLASLYLLIGVSFFMSCGVERTFNPSPNEQGPSVDSEEADLASYSGSDYSRSGAERAPQENNANNRLSSYFAFIDRNSLLALEELIIAGNKWVCEACTFGNPDSAKFCELCGTLKVNIETEWCCEACTFINPLSADTCESCGLAHATLRKIPLEEDTEETCPICLEEDKLLSGKHVCQQCKKAICEPCYQDVLKSRNKYCPLCRYENY